ncbi:MAG: hypothetical protein AAGF33_05735 [Pseudomonadota bacterium]
MRKQIHFRPSANGFYAWDVDRLVRLSSGLRPNWIDLDQIAELDEAYWFYTGDEPTCRTLADHFKLVTEADLQYPVILCADGRVMDGMHRVTKAYSLGKKQILSVRFAKTPDPDFSDVQPADVFDRIKPS